MSGSTNAVGKAVKDFLAEAEEIIDQLGTDLGSMSDCADSGECNPDLLNSVFRGAHSLKGLAGMFGFSQIQELAHTLENLLDSLRLGKVGLSQQIMTVLFDSLEMLGSMVRGINEGSTDEPGLSLALSRITACVQGAQKVDQASLVDSLGLSPGVISALTEYEEHRLLENIKKGRSIYSLMASFDLTTFDQDLGDLTESLKKIGEVVSTLPSVGGNIEAAIDFEILFGSDRGLDEVSALVVRPNVTVRLLGNGPSKAQAAAIAPATAPAAVVPSVVQPIPGLTEAVQVAADGSLTAKSMSRTVRVDIGKLDDLMNIVGELVLSHSTISDIAERMRRAGFTNLVADLVKSAKGLDRKLNELQKGVMEIRMIPVGQLYEKMGRIVRKISREQGKKVDLKLFGADTELDKLIIEDISDPMMHIIRNAIDHGIETPEERRQVGKSEKGTIKLSSYQKGNHVVIEVEDDGSGIDVAKVKKKALATGLIASYDAVSDREALELIFLPGFSTADKISEVSGRGVGMDVVRNNIAAVCGMVDIDSTFGAGSKVTITLPITLAIIKALIVSTAERTYALPITSVLETIILEEKEILTVERKEVIQLREHTLPLLRLNDFFELRGAAPATENLYVVVVGAAEKRLGIVVDDLLGQQDIVIKSLGTLFDGLRGISGAADLGDQRTILVLDVGGIISEATKGSA
jgi:two-component system chemotaxis sensor kinase CheA